MRYAHARGVIHRDLKPANVMIGPYGEVTVLDWGIAKPVRKTTATTSALTPLERTLVDSHDKRLQETGLGALAGTPLYMSPEQAAGRNDELDERSDVFSLCILLFEWLALEHPLTGVKTVPEVLAAIISGKLESRDVFGRALALGVPAEWIHLINKGLVADRAKRLQSVDDLEKRLRAVLDGHVTVACHVTFTKRVVFDVLHWIDRHPYAYYVLFRLGIVAAMAAVGFGGYELVRALVH
jgi:serine/threonine protein kinase